MNSFRSSRLGRTSAPILAAGVFLLLAAVVALWQIYETFRVDVPSKHIAILIKKTGLDLKNGDEVAPDETYKGVQREALAEGRDFRNPYYWDWEVIPQLEIPEDKLGVRIRLVGDELPLNEFQAKKETDKGIVPEILGPGRYAINPYVEKVELHDPVTIPAGFKGVVTNLAGPLAENPNSVLVKEGFRGTQQKTLEPGTYYINPYITRVNLVDCRSQRFNLSEKKDMGLPSKDGFWVALDGIVEFRINPEKAAEIYVTYNDDINGEDMNAELVRKVILPNARSFCRIQGSNSLGREFIQGDTRTKFQEGFHHAMDAACEPLGIDIVQALITRIRPPEQIAGPVRDREIAKQQEKQYQQEILQQDSEQKLAVQNEMVKQKQALVAAQQEVNQATIDAMREQEVAITKGNEKLAVSELKLEAARDEAAAILSRGQGAARKIELANLAEAAGWKRSVGAFDGNGQQFAQYVLYQKLAAAYRKIMVNTADSPIMKVFESFENGGPATVPHVAGAANAEATRPVTGLIPTGQPVNAAPAAGDLGAPSGSVGAPTEEAETPTGELGASTEGAVEESTEESTSTAGP